jgi:hypothetical protein
VERQLKIYFYLTLLITIVFISPEPQAQEPSFPYKPAEMIIKLKSEVPADETDILKLAAEQSRFHQFGNVLDKQGKVETLHAYSWANLYHLKLSNPNASAEELEFEMNEIQKMKEVEYVEKNFIFSLDAVLEAIDYEAAKREPSLSQFESPETQMDEFSDIEDAVKKVIVAVIDTGVDYTHRDLASHMWHNKNEISGDGIDNDGNGFIDDVKGWDFANNDNDPYDDHYHGTHVSGIVLSVQDVRDRAIQIMPVKFLSGSGFGSTGDAIQAIDYAVKNGASVLNNSWGGGSYSQALRDAIISSYYANRVFVVAAQNRAENLDEKPAYPPSYLIPNMITVAALDDQQNLAWFSNYGPKTVHVGAKGVSVYSTVPKERCENPPCYAYLSGTSMSTPYVAGIAAMMFSKNPDLMHLQVKEIMMKTSSKNSSLAGKIGEGSVEGEAAITVAINTPPDTGGIPPYTPSSIPSLIGLDPKITAASAMAGCGFLNDRNDDPDGASSIATLFFLAWPLLFIFFMKFLFNTRPKFFFCQF